MNEQTKNKIAIGASFVGGAVVGVGVTLVGVTSMGTTSMDRVWCHWDPGTGCKNYLLFECKPNPPLKNGQCPGT